MIIKIYRDCPVKLSPEFLTIIKFIFISIYLTIDDYITNENSFFEEAFPINIHSILNLYKTCIYILDMELNKKIRLKVTILFISFGYNVILLVTMVINFSI